MTVDTERLDLKYDLDEAVGDGEKEVDGRELRESDALPLFKRGISKLVVPIDRPLDFRRFKIMFYALCIDAAPKLCLISSLQQRLSDIQLTRSLNLEPMTFMMDTAHISMSALFKCVQILDTHEVKTGNSTFLNKSGRKSESATRAVLRYRQQPGLLRNQS